MKTQQILTNLVPRILAIVYIIFIALLSLDVFSANASLLEKMGGLLVHNIPTIILLAVLFLAYKKPMTGGYVFIVMGIIFTFFYRTYQRWDTFVLISFPLLIIGILFLLNKEKIENN